MTAYDTSGSEAYKSLTSGYIKDKHCIIYVFDVSLRESFDSLNDWQKWADEFRREDVVSVLVGAKTDLETREVETREAMNWARKN